MLSIKVVPVAHFANVGSLFVAPSLGVTEPWSQQRVEVVGDRLHAGKLLEKESFVSVDL